MANTITGLIPDLYAALEVVSRELLGFIPSVTHDSEMVRAAVDEDVKIPFAPTSTATNITPGVTPPDDGDQTMGYRTIKLSKARRVPFRWRGEETKALNNGPGQLTLQQQQIAQAMRTLTNEIEADLAALYITTSRAYGTAGTTPFASTLADPAQVGKILTDNGTPTSDRQMVINTTAGAALRTLAQLNKANEAGTDQTLRRGLLLDLHGFSIRESAQVKTHTKGTAAAYAVDLVAGYAVGATTIHVDIGTGTMVAGDILANTQSGRDSTLYVVATGQGGDADQDVVIAAPGLRVAWQNNDTVVVGANYAANMAFSRSAILLATRPPALPDGGDMADDRILITDPVSGLTFEVAVYRQYRQVQYEISIVWGVANIKPEHTALLLG